ncbi:hypothetical protein HMPREF9074_08112 [Capnocytophaga sp. oral taxon 329 str. F0087]|nr:hypothetical protein HMPREF9074_08112 [Capnocytophaga sp. oral taxon 329 str. F0087]
MIILYFWQRYKTISNSQITLNKKLPLYWGQFLVVYIESFTNSSY